jgi:hypothetical protein
MSTTAVGHCPHCAAVVNRHWPSCLVCHVDLVAASTHSPVEAVSAVPSSRPPIQPSWRELAQMTAGLERDDPRLGPVLSALAACEAHDKAGDRSGFEHAAERVTRLMQFAPGAHVRWRGSEGHVLKVLGPAQVEHVHCSEGQLWVWTAWKGQGRWVPEYSIIAMEDHGTRCPPISTGLLRERSEGA